MIFCITVFIAVVPQMIGVMLHLATDVTQYGPHEGPSFLKATNSMDTYVCTAIPQQ